MSVRLQVNGKNLTLHYLTVVGSTLHNLAGEDSDVDVKGVFTWEQDVVNGLNEPQDTLCKTSMNKEDRKELITQLNKLFDREFDDDLDLFSAKKFFKNTMKCDPNMLDMLFANTVPLDFGNPVLYSSSEFDNVLDHRDLFVNFKVAKYRFLGMSFNTLKLGSKENNKNKFKDLAKSLQSLFSFQNMVEGGFKPQLKESQRQEVLAVKFNTYFKDHSELVELVKKTRAELEAECETLELPETKDNFEELNKLLLTLSW